MLKNFIHKLSAVLVAFALLWIFAGSLVEFHQRYVFHKQVDLWQVVVTQSGKDFKKSLRLIDKNWQHANGLDLFASNHSIVSLPVHLQLSEKSIFSRYLFDMITSEYDSDKVLRGPPVA